MPKLFVHPLLESLHTFLLWATSILLLVLSTENFQGETSEKQASDMPRDCFIYIV